MSVGHDRRDPDGLGYRPHTAPAVKDTKRWCRGKEGVEHQPATALDTDGYLRPCGPRPEWAREASPGWWCKHRRVCSDCGKVLAPSIPSRDCPARPSAVEELSREEGRELFDSAARRLTGLSGVEVLALFDTGEAWTRWDHFTASDLYMLAPFAR
jgi:hypothetical protein